MVFIRNLFYKSSAYWLIIIVSSLSLSSALAGKPPVFSIDRLEGGSYNLKEDLGKSVILLEFWGMCCKAKLSKLKYIDELYKKYQDMGLKVYAINIDDASSRSKVRPALKKYGYSFPILLDPYQEVLRKYSPAKIKPYTVIIGKNGKIIHEFSGDKPVNVKLVERIIREQIGEES